MNERSRRVVAMLIAIAITSLLGASSSPALAVNQTINGGTLRMTGLILDPMRVSAGSLRMTGLAVAPATISGGTLRMTGMAQDRSLVPSGSLQPHKR